MYRVGEKIAFFRRRNFCWEEVILGRFSLNIIFDEDLLGQKKYFEGCIRD